MSYQRTLARTVAHNRMRSMGAHVNSKRAGKSPFSEHWREFAPGRFKNVGSQVHRKNWRQKAKAWRRRKAKA